VKRRSVLAGLGVLMASLALAAPWQLERSDVLEVKGADGHAYRVMVAWPDGPPPPGLAGALAAGWRGHFAIAAMTARRLTKAGCARGCNRG
jgi:hypothetical protein